jgi:hypothetical protein
MLESATAGATPGVIPAGPDAENMRNMSESPIHYLVYVSAATALLSKPALLELLTRARENNHRLGITGLLLYKDGDFIQLLEGPQAQVKALYEIIEADPRHTGAMVMLEGDRNERLFDDWSMGFRDLTDPEVQATPGFSHFMNTPLVAKSFANNPNDCLKLLSLFSPRY